MPTILGEGVTPEEAIKYWKSKVLMPSSEAKKLSDNARSRAFYVSGLAQLDQVKTVHEALLSALENGETLADFKTNIAGLIQKEGWHSYRVENIFQTNMQTAYSAGRYAQMRKALRTRPYWQYLVILDKRTRANHAVLHRITYPADHEFWASHYPPNGFRCRCTVRSLSQRQVDKDNVTIQKKMPSTMVYIDPKTGMETFVHNPQPDKGFSGNVGANWLGGLDMSKYPSLHKDSYKEQRTQVIPIAKDYDELGDNIKSHLGAFATNNGIKNIIIDKKSRSFMATNSHGDIWLTDYTFSQCKDFNPSKDLLDAWNKTAKGEKLTWNQEYAMESLWHEITHNRQKSAFLKRNSSEQVIMETVTQWTARRTYPQMLEKIGGKAYHQEDILQNGLGYGGYLKRFDNILDELKIDKETFLHFLEDTMETKRRNEYLPSIEIKLAEMSGIKKGFIKRVLANVKDSSYKFNKAMEALRSKKETL